MWVLLSSFTHPRPSVHQRVSRFVPLNFFLIVYWDSFVFQHIMYLSVGMSGSYLSNFENVLHLHGRPYQGGTSCSTGRAWRLCSLLRYGSFHLSLLDRAQTIPYGKESTEYWSATHFFLSRWRVNNTLITHWHKWASLKQQFQGKLSHFEISYVENICLLLYQSDTFLWNVLALRQTINLQLHQTISEYSHLKSTI